MIGNNKKASDRKVFLVGERGPGFVQFPKINVVRIIKSSEKYYRAEVVMAVFDGLTLSDTKL